MREDFSLPRTFDESLRARILLPHVLNKEVFMYVMH